MLPVRPYLLGGAASGALVGGSIAALLSITAVVSESNLSDGMRTPVPPSVGTVHIARPPASGLETGSPGIPASPAPLALAVPTGTVTGSTAFSPATAAVAPAGFLVGSRESASAHRSSGSGAAKRHHSGHSHGSSVTGAGQAPAPSGVAKTSSGGDGS